MQGRGRSRLEQALADGVAVGVPTLVVYELWYGINKSLRLRENALTLAAFLALDVTLGRSSRTTPKRPAISELRWSGPARPIGPYDVFIAAPARRRGARLVTANQREFARVPGLRIEDWASTR